MKILNNITKINNKTFSIIIFIIALINGIIWGMPFYEISQDTAVKNDAGMFILENGIFGNDIYMNHLVDRVFYPILTAGVFKIFGPYPAVMKLLNLIMFAFLALLVYKLCQIIFSEKLARVAGLFTALCYTLAGFTSHFDRQIFFVFLIFLLIYCLYQAQVKNKNIWYILSGLIFGMALLTNAIIQFFIVIIIANFLILNWSKGIKKIIPKIVILLLASAIFISPIFISNFLNFDRTPVLSKQGILLAMRAEKMQAIKGKYIEHLIANITGDLIVQKIFDDYDRSEARLGWNTLEEWQTKVYEQGYDMKEADYQFTKKAIWEFIKHPFLFIEITSIDFLKFNTPMTPDVRMQHMFAEPDSHPELSDSSKIAIILFIRFVYLIFAILIIYAGIKLAKRWSKASWIILIILYFNLIFSFLHAIARLSLPIYPFYIILLTMGVLMVWDKILSFKK